MKKTYFNPIVSVVEYGVIGNLCGSSKAEWEDGRGVDPEEIPIE